MDEQIIGPKCEVVREQVFRPHARLLTIGRRHVWVGTKDGRCDSCGRRRQWAALRHHEEVCRYTSICYLLESLRTVLFDGSRQIGEDIAVEEDSVPCAEYPLGRWTPSQPN